MQREIVIRVQGGLGNQLFQYAMGRSLSLQTGATLRLDPWEFEIDTKRRYELGRLNIRAATIRRGRGRWEFRLRRRRYAPLRRVLDRVQPRLGYRRIVHHGDGYLEGLADLPGNLYLDGFWQSERYFAAHRATLLEELAFKEPPDPPNAACLADIAARNAVCVHVRRGDYVALAHFNARFGTCGLDYYQRAISHVRERVERPAFFVFSDDPAWVRENFPPLDDMTMVSHNVGVNDPEDLRLMMNCRHFVIANSSFSWWAAWLGRFPGKIVVAPPRWHASPEFGEKDLVPESWVRV